MTVRVAIVALWVMLCGVAPVTAQPAATFSTLLLDDQSVSGTSQAHGVNGGYDLTFHVEWSAGTSAGVITIEEATSPGYTGTWSSITTVSWSAESATDTVHLSGTFRAVRARISTGITGGTVDVRLTGSAR